MSYLPYIQPVSTPKNETIYAHKRFDEKKKTRKSVGLGSRTKPNMKPTKRSPDEELAK